MCTVRGTQTCTADADCGPMASCLEGVCQGGTACGSNADCGSGEACDPVSGVCQFNACDAQGGCPNGGACNHDTNRCGPRRACARDDQCQAPYGTCDGGFCAPGCQKTGCAQGLACQANGKCGLGGGGGGCTSDAACGAPTNICHGGSCVAGCATTGCSGSQTCNTSTGRCQGGGGGGCASDGECGMGNICQAGTCVAGCSTTGCSGGQTCNHTTGRCQAGGGGGCTSDAACGAPTNVCQGGSCVPSCLTAGCSYGEECNRQTGRCGAPPVCHSHSECSTGYCLTPPGYPGADGFCTKPCATTTDCGAGERCGTPLEAPGITVCLGPSRTGTATGTGQLGDDCVGTNPGACQSGYCMKSYLLQNVQYCADSCSRDADCNLPGIDFVCRGHASGTGHVLACTLEADVSLYLGQEAIYPFSCVDDFIGMPSCQSNLCVGWIDPQENVAPGAEPHLYDVCFQGCCSSADCPSVRDARNNLRNSVCQPVQPFDLLQGKQSTTVMKACVPAAANGTAGFGAACSLDDGLNCRSNVCVGNLANGSETNQPYCTDFCCTNSDCPSGFSCLPGTDDVSGVSFNICLKR